MLANVLKEYILEFAFTGEERRLRSLEAFVKLFLDLHHYTRNISLTIPETLPPQTFPQHAPTKGVPALGAHASSLLLRQELFSLLLKVLIAIFEADWKPAPQGDRVEFV